MPAGVWTGLEPRASVGPLESDVGLKETHLLVHPGLSLGHLPWDLARLLFVELAITSSLGLTNRLLASKGWSFSSAEISAQRASFLCSGNVHAPCRTVLCAPSQTLQWHVLGCQ